MSTSPASSSGGVVAVYVPSLHPAAVPASAPAGAARLDPGEVHTVPGPAVDENASSRPVWRPENLPLDKHRATDVLCQLTGLGEMFPRTSDLAAWSASGDKDPYGLGRTLGRSEIEDLLRFEQGVGPEPAPGALDEGVRNAKADVDPSTVPDVTLLRAQVMLLLARHMEGDILETRALTARVDAASGNFVSSLGMEEGELDNLKELEAAASFEGASVLAEETRVLGGGVPWQRVLEAVIVLVGEGAVLVSMDPDVVGSWKDVDLEFHPVDTALAETLFPGGAPEGEWLCVEAPGWKLAGLPGPGKRPWLSRRLRAVCPA